jgi:hypothetical protein
MVMTSQGQSGLHSLRQTDCPSPMDRLGDRVRKSLTARGAAGLFVLTRAFHTIDASSSGQLRTADFKRALREVGTRRCAATLDAGTTRSTSRTQVGLALSANELEQVLSAFEDGACF